MSVATSDETVRVRRLPFAALAGVAWRGVLAHRRRTGVLVVANALGVVAVALSLGLQRWSHETLLGLTSDAAHGLGRVERPGHHRSRDPRLRFPEEPAPLDATRAASFGARWTAILEWPALVEGPRDQAPVRLEATRVGFRATPASGAAARPAAVAGRVSPELAARLGVDRGGRTRLRLRDARGGEIAVAATLAPAARGDGGPGDRFTVALALEDLQALVGERCVTAWGIELDRALSAEEVLGRLSLVKGALRDASLTVVSWRDTAPDVEGITEVQRRAVYLLVAILVIVQTIGVANTFVLGIIDRTRELGVLTALGLEPRDLDWLIQLEAWITSALGALAGIVLSVPVSWFLAHHGLDFSASAKTLEVAGQVMPPIIRAYIGPAEVALGTVLALVVGPAAGWWPARRIATLDPVEALRAA
ncbi:MAG: FtsX-like permease family protein [bacterium]